MTEPDAVAGKLHPEDDLWLLVNAVGKTAYQWGYKNAKRLAGPYPLDLEQSYVGALNAAYHDLRDAVRERDLMRPVVEAAVDWIVVGTSEDALTRLVDAAKAFAATAPPDGEGHDGL